MSRDVRASESGRTTTARAEQAAADSPQARPASASVAPLDLLDHSPSDNRLALLGDGHSNAPLGVISRSGSASGATLPDRFPARLEDHSLGGIQIAFDKVSAEHLIEIAERLPGGFATLVLRPAPAPIG
jgi:hypothetical protein